MTEKKCTLNCCVHSSLPFVIIAGCSILCVWQNQCVVQTVFQGYCTSQTELVQSFRNIFTDTSSSWVLDFGNPVSCELRYEFPVYAALKTDTRRLLRSSTCFVPVSSIVGTFFATRLHDSWEPANCSYLSNMSLSKNKNSWESPGFWEVGRYHLCMSEPWLCQGTTLSLYLGIVRGALISRLPLRTKPLVKAEPRRCWAALLKLLLHPSHLKDVRGGAWSCIQCALTKKGHGVIFRLMERGTECRKSQDFAASLPDRRVREGRLLLLS